MFLPQTNHPNVMFIYLLICDLFSDLLLCDSHWTVQEGKDGKEDKNSPNKQDTEVGKHATAISNVQSSRRGRDRVATAMMESVNLLLT
jgi:hypothetical protein